MLITLLIFVAVLGILVFVHEFGHFSAAKLFKVKVEEFAIGFPPKLFGVKRGETQYNINLIPLGGYVSIKGEGGNFQEDKDSFSSRNVWQRGLIIIAGVLMNFFTAVFFLWVGYLIGLPVSIEERDFRGAYVKDESIQIIQVLQDLPAEAAGLKMGDIILTADSQKFTQITDLQAYFSSKENTTVKLEIKRGSEILNKDVGTAKLPQTKQYGIGVALTKSAIVSYPPFRALGEAFGKATGMTKDIVLSLGYLFENLFSGEKVDMQVSGPVGIAVMTGEMSHLGFVYLLQFIAILSINLAIINLFPFPALDGSRLIFLAVEGIRGRSINQKIEQVIHTMGFSFLMLLMLLVTYKDLARYGGEFWSRIISIF